MNEIRVFMPHSIRGRGYPYWRRYREPNSARSTIELVITAVPFVILWILMWGALGSGYWVGLLLAVPAAGFLVRLFMIQHDCGHGSFFRRRLTNDWVGRVIGDPKAAKWCVAGKRRDVAISKVEYGEGPTMIAPARVLIRHVPHIGCMTFFTTYSPI